MKAIPTTFEGIKYRSRLEARWAEFLTDRGIDFEYEPDDWEGEYRPDFLLLCFGIYVEVKPEALFHELNMFRFEIDTHDSKWICVDKATRTSWKIIHSNLTFSDGCRLDIPRHCKIDFRTSFNKKDDGLQQLILECPFTLNGL